MPSIAETLSPAAFDNVVPAFELECTVKSRYDTTAGKLNTSEFSDVRGRLAMLHNRRKVDTEKDSNRPRLRRAPGTGTGPVDEGTNDDKQKPDQDERPTLKRHDDSSK